MSYAVIVTGGKQYKVAEGEFLKIEKLEVATGESVTSIAFCWSPTVKKSPSVLQLLLALK